MYLMIYVWMLACLGNHGCPSLLTRRAFLATQTKTLFPSAFRNTARKEWNPSRKWTTFQLKLQYTIVVHKSSCHDLLLINKIPPHSFPSQQYTSQTTKRKNMLHSISLVLVLTLESQYSLLINAFSVASILVWKEVKVLMASLHPT